jgi:hypothetical protein
MEISYVQKLRMYVSVKMDSNFWQEGTNFPPFRIKNQIGSYPTGSDRERRRPERISEQGNVNNRDIHIEYCRPGECNGWNIETHATAIFFLFIKYGLWLRLFLQILIFLRAYLSHLHNASAIWCNIPHTDTTNGRLEIRNYYDFIHVSDIQGSLGRLRGKLTYLIMAHMGPF